MPINHSVLEPIINFLYTDDCKVLENCNDIDFISSLLVVADQLFIERLKELCEVALSQLLTLKNCPHMLQFACTYHARQLKYCVTEFICLNLPAVLESRSLESLDDEILDDLTEFYCNWNTNLSKRVITPFSDAPSDEIVKSVSDLNPIVFKSDESDNEGDVKIQKTNTKKKIRIRKNSENSRNRTKEDSSLLLTLDETVHEKSDVTKEQVVEKNVVQDEKWVKILTEKEKHQKIVKARLKAVATVKEEMNKSVLPDNYTKLTKTPIKNSKEIISPIQSPIGSPKFYSPLQSPNSSYTDSPTFKSPGSYDIPILKAQKMSQKQRKKLALDASTVAEQLDNVNRKPISPSEANKQNDGAAVNLSPKNPWKKIQEPVSIPEQEEKNFADIVADEKKQRENWTKMRAKPLVYTQVSEKKNLVSIQYTL